jgi:hypothetical protein
VINLKTAKTFSVHVKRWGPLAPTQREEGHVVDALAQRLVADEAEPDDLLLAAADRHGASTQNFGY